MRPWIRQAGRWGAVVKLSGRALPSRFVTIRLCFCFSALFSGGLSRLRRRTGPKRAVSDRQRRARAARAVSRGPWATPRGIRPCLRLRLRVGVRVGARRCSFAPGCKEGARPLVGVCGSARVRARSIGSFEPATAGSGRARAARSSPPSAHCRFEKMHSRLRPIENGIAMESAARGGAPAVGGRSGQARRGAAGAAFGPVPRGGLVTRSPATKMVSDAKPGCASSSKSEKI